MKSVMKIVALFTFAHFSHHVLTALITPLLPFMRSDLGLSYAQAGIVLSAFSLSYGIGQSPAGWLADRLGPKLILTVGIAGVGVAGILVGLSSGYALLLVSLVLMGLAGGGYHPAASPLIIAAVEPREQGRALGIHVTGGSVSHFAAPLIGAFLAGWFGWRGAFLGLSLPVILLGLYFYKAYGRRQAEDAAAEAAAREGRKKEAAADVRGGMPRALLLELSVFILLVTATGSALTATVSFVPLYMVDTFGSGERTAAAFLSLFYATGLFAAPAAGRISDLFGRRRVVSTVGIISAAGIILLPFLPAGFGFAALLFLLGAMLFSRMPPAEAHIIGLTPKHIRGTVMGIYYFAGMEGSGILTPLLGVLIDAFGFKRGFLYMGTGLAVVTVICITVIFSIERKKKSAAVIQGTVTGA